MPTYCYKCDSCHQEKEIEQKMSDPHISVCPFCQKETFKRIPPKDVGIQFKGSGFYITDYGDKKPPESKGGCGKGSCGCQ